MQRMAEATTSDYTAGEYKAVIADALDLIADTRTQLIGIKDTVHQAHVQFKEMRERVEELEMALKKRALEGLTQSGEYEELSAQNEQLKAQLAMAQASRSGKIEEMKRLINLAISAAEGHHEGAGLKYLQRALELP
jgi:hypothetical protein